MKTKKRRRAKHTHRNAGDNSISFDDIMNSIVETKSEYCGYKEGDQFILTHIGPAKESSSQRGSCIAPNRPVIWHTHTIHSKYFPSMEDIHKVFKHATIHTSIIYTVFGFWVMTYAGRPVRLSEAIHEYMNEILGEFYRATERGRAYDRDAIERLSYRFNTEFPGFTIEWQEFDA
jgi:hypothetical protein